MPFVEEMPFSGGRSSEVKEEVEEVLEVRPKPSRKLSVL